MVRKHLQYQLWRKWGMGSRGLRREEKESLEIKKVTDLDLQVQASEDSPRSLGLGHFSSFQRLSLSLQKVSYLHTKDIYINFLVYEYGW